MLLEGPSTPATEAAQVPPELTTAMPLSTTEATSFKGLVCRLLDIVGAPSHLFVPAFAQHIISTLVASL